MPDTRLPRVKPGDEVAAYHVNSASEALERQKILPGAGVKVAEGPAGTTLTADVPTGFWATLGAAVTPSGGVTAYGFFEQIPLDGGGWAAGPTIGDGSTIAGYPVPPSSTVLPVGLFVWMRLTTTSNNFSFEYGTCQAFV